MYNRIILFKREIERMKQITKITSSITLLLLTGCAAALPSMTSHATDAKQQKALFFQTNQVHFMHTLKERSTQQVRNEFMDEFLLKSDIQCQNYLNNSLQKPEPNQQEDSLYMNIFDTVSGLFGTSLVTNTAKAVFLENGETAQEEKQAYTNALSPEIRKGVELGRSRYAKTMTQKKSLDLKAYSIQDLKTDMLKYDKQCNDAYGLIEINRALKEMQNSVYATPTLRTPSLLKIDPTSIKEKVVAATKEVEEKKVEKARIINKTLDSNTTTVLPTQPKPVDAPVHHDNVPNLPHSTQPLNE